MEKIELSSVLQEGQEYVKDIREYVQAVKHDEATNTCFEKADLLGWLADRVVKAIFFSGQGKMYGLVFPELGTREEPERFSQRDLGVILGYTNKQRKCIRNSTCPKGMEFGTCTPFVPEYAFEKDGDSIVLEKIFVHDAPWLDNQIVDISIGGYGVAAHKVSLHLPYKIIYSLLNKKFGQRIEKKTLLAE
jgi:hypothetical protein